MKRKWFTFTTWFVLLLSIASVSSVGAHTVTYWSDINEPDRSRNEWFETANNGQNGARNGAKTADVGHSIIARNEVNEGEFIFRDATKDTRVLSSTLTVSDTTELARAADIDWFAITGEPGFLNFLIKQESIDGALSELNPMFVITISTNGNSSNTTIPESGGLTIPPEAAWEYAILTDFNSTVNTGNYRPPKRWVYTSGTAGNCTGCLAQLIGRSNGGVPGNFVEIKVPWSQIGFTNNQPPPQGTALRFTLSTYLKSEHLADVVPGDDKPALLLLDAASTRTTAEIVSAGFLDTYMDVYFDTNGDVFSPLLISEFNPNPEGTEPAGPNGRGTEWIEIINVSSFNVSLDNYSIGDAVRRGSADAMLKFPAGKTVPPNGVVIVAQDKNKPPIAGLSSSPSLQIFQWAPNNVVNGEMPPNTIWSSKTTIGLDNQRDRVVLTYRNHTIMDLVEYKVETNSTSPYPGHIAYVYEGDDALLTSVPEGNQYSIERCPVKQDTNDAALDFTFHNGATDNMPTPGIACPPTTGVDLEVRQVASTSAALAGSQVIFTIQWSNLGDGPFSSVLLTDTLPLHLNFVSASPAPDAGRSTATQKVWNFTNLTPPSGGTVGGTIILTATISASAPANLPLVNRVEISENDPTRVEAEHKLGNNSYEATVTAMKPDLAVSSTWPGGALPNDTVEYVIAYANNGSGMASNVVITDTLPAAGATFVSSTPAPDGSSTATEKVWSLGELDPGDTGTITVRVKITGNTNDQLTNQIVITGEPADDPGAPTADNSETRILVVGVIPNLEVEIKDWPDKAKPGGTFCYTIEYTYPKGAIQATDIQIKNTLPTGLSLVSQTSSPALNFNGATTGELVWGPGTLNVGGKGTITVCVKVRSIVPVGEEVENVVSISGSVDPDPTLADNIKTAKLTFDSYQTMLPFIGK